MKITKKQLKRIIKEEKEKLLKEQYGMTESLSPVAQFGMAWSSLGSRVGEQINTVVNAFIENNEDMAFEINPNALDLGLERLRTPLNMLGQSNPDAEELLEALEWAENLFKDEGMV